MNPLQNKHIILGVTGSIAAYKAADLASKLTQQGAIVHTILTDAATKFISTLTLQSVTGEFSYTDKDLWGNQAHILHVGLAHQADYLIIAPATATTIAKLSHGIADNLLTVTALACGTGEDSVPMIIAPAMDGGMYAHEATQENINTLKQRGAIFIGPEEGHLASGLKAIGRMTEPSTLVENLRFQLSRVGPLAKKSIVVTAGGTQEDIDPIRTITNRSSGKQGYALAQSATDSGADVTLISGPTHLTPPAGAKYLPIRSSEDMRKATLETCMNADVLIMAAAVSDFSPTKVEAQKIKKGSGVPVLSLKKTTDILLEIKKQRASSGFPKIVVGFAAETEHLMRNAQSKLKNKGLELIVANDVSAKDAGFSVDSNRVTLLFKDGCQEKLPLLSKADVAEKIIQAIISLIEA
jgi:phosphopantothenoylcysteine decarboxylase/phosphopantothenate--cysteine ligase